MESSNIYDAKEILAFANKKSLLNNIERTKPSLMRNTKLCVQMRCRLEN